MSKKKQLLPSAQPEPKIHVQKAAVKPKPVFTPKPHPHELLFNPKKFD